MSNGGKCSEFTQIAHCASHTKDIHKRQSMLSLNVLLGWRVSFAGPWTDNCSCFIPCIVISIDVIIRVVAMVGGAGQGRPPLTISARHRRRKNYLQFFFFFFFAVPGTMFHNRGSIIAQYTYVIYIENDLVRLWIPAGALPVDPSRWRCASLASLTPLAIIIHNYFPPLRLGWLQPWLLCTSTCCMQTKLISFIGLINDLNWIEWIQKNSFNFKDGLNVITTLSLVCHVLNLWPVKFFVVDFFKWSTLCDSTSFCTILTHATRFFRCAR